MVFGHNRLTIPNDEEYSVKKLRMMIKEIEVLFGLKISAEWNNL